MSRRPLKIGITCYPTFGGSGVIATEIGMAMAKRGHRVHFICYDVPRRLQRFTENIFYHEVEVHDNPLFLYPPYSLALASKMVEVTTYEQLDLLHVHYAVPHATSAYLAKQMLGDKAPKVITTLHGTDITLVGNERNYLPMTRFSIIQSDGVTAPSQFLKHATYDKLNVPTTFQIEVIANFVDTMQFRPKDPLEGRSKLEALLGTCSIQEKIICHVSNFRPVKRLHDVIEVFARVNQEVPCHLMLVGDGPERSKMEKMVRDLKLSGRVCFLGKQETFVEILQHSDAFLLPSQNESFGLAALEAMSCGVPVIGSNAEGIPEVVVNKEVGFLSDIGDVQDMAKNLLRLLTEPDLHRRMSEGARQRVEEHFNQPLLCNQYEDYYYRIVGE